MTRQVAREGRHPGRLAQTLGEVMDLVLRHPDGDPCEDDEEHIKRAAGGAEGLAAGEFILENVLVKGLGEQDQREGEAQMHAALHGVVEQAEKAGVNIKMNTKVTAQMLKEDTPDAVILATGSETLVLPFIKGIHNPDIVYGVDCLEGTRPVGHKVLVVGGGMVGAETADFLAEQDGPV